MIVCCLETFVAAVVEEVRQTDFLLSETGRCGLVSSCVDC